MARKDKEAYKTLRKKLGELEEIYFSTKERLKTYGAKDSSENSDWILLNEKLAICQLQIDSLKAKIAAISQENSKVIVYRSLETGEEKKVQLTDGETDPDQGKISPKCPLGIVLNTKKVGEIGEYKVGQKKYQVQILDIKAEN